MKRNSAINAGCAHQQWQLSSTVWVPPMLLRAVLVFAVFETVLPEQMVGQEATQAKKDSEAQTLAKGVAARARVMQSGTIQYKSSSGREHLPRPDGIEVGYAWDGSSWIRYCPSKPDNLMLNHNGRCLILLGTPQPDGRTDFSLTVQRERSIYSQTSPEPRKPLVCGSIWFPETLRFIRAHSAEARLVGDGVVNDIRTKVLEWNVHRDVTHRDWPRDWPFHAMTKSLLPGGTLRLHVAPDLGYALPLYEYVNEAGQVVLQFQSEDFREVAPEVFLPFRCRQRGTHENNHEYEIVITKAERINESLPEHLFQFQVPRGTRVSGHLGDFITGEAASTNQIAGFQESIPLPLLGTRRVPTGRLESARGWTIAVMLIAAVLCVSAWFLWIKSK